MDDLSSARGFPLTNGWSLQREISLCSSLALSPSPVDHSVSLFSVFLGSVVIEVCLDFLDSI
ncbi:hypothetical protein PanWU01x14_351190 [Parasponia andersonii]|uniref:Uncharacterized protein n=1 Tax=Parasponia andersonii TaxID=3476 RepID=A0A2P5AAU5_PARAD|nr:hypothetical protein PanWU01x14_351190 [Parasponia andersonii]